MRNEWHETDKQRTNVWKQLNRKKWKTKQAKKKQVSTVDRATGIAPIKWP